MNAGGFITEANGHFRINGNLNLSRSIGDLKYKQNSSLRPEEQMITAEPDVIQMTLTAMDEFMVLACDGIWDVMSNEEAVAFARERLQKGMALEKICDELMDNCIASDTKETRGIGGDNMTVVIVTFKQ